MDNFKGSELGRRSLRIANHINSNMQMKPLGVCNPPSSYERKSSYQKSPINARKSLFDSYSKENDDFALCAEFSAKREYKGNSPVVVHKIESSNVPQDNKKVKPRRSMLGLRSKTQLTNFVKDDITYTVSKPLQASSPNNIERSGSYNYGDLNLKPLSHKSVSTPLLTPFDSDVTNTSAFFNKGISDSTWSVFKSAKKKTTVDRPVTRGLLMAGKAKLLRKSIVSSVDQEVKLKWLAQKFQMERSNFPLASNNDKLVDNESSGDEHSSENEEDEAHEEEVHLQNEPETNLKDSIQDCISPIEIGFKSQDLNETSNSTDSYIQNEITILNSDKNNLEKIDEESVGKIYVDNTSKDDFCTKVPNSETVGILKIINLFEDLKTEKDNMDSKWHALMEQREVFENKWNYFKTLLRTYAENPNSSNKNFVNFNSDKRKPKQVNGTKPRHSLLVSPGAYLTITNSSLTRSSKAYSQLKPNLGSCKTPASSDKILKRYRKSGCYTPNTLSVMVDDQTKDIFG